MEIELPVPAPDGQRRWLLVRMSPHGVGPAQRWYGLAADVTHLQAAITARVDAQTRRSVEMLAGGVAHAINNQLTVVLASASLALSRCAVGDPARVAFERIQAAGTRAARIATHLLAFSRNQVLLPTAVDLSALVLGLAPTLRDALGAGRRLDVQAPPTPVWAWVDAGRLQQVLDCLLSNARDAGAERVLLRVLRVESPALPGREGTIPGAWCRIDVIDSGAGMTPEVRARAFEPFFTTRPRATGGGMGLAFVEGTVRQSGGQVAIESREGEGTSVHLLLPPPPVAAARDLGARGEVPAAGDASILVVEDEEVVRELVREVLGAEGYRVIVAGSARQAREVIRGFDVAPSALLIDADLGDGGGRELVELVRARWPVPVLYTSGHPQGEVVRRGMAELGAPFLRKPFLPEELLGALSVLRRSG